MANVNPTVPATFDDVYQLEITDVIEAGPGGNDNKQALALVNRTQYLLDQITEMKKKLPRFRGYITGIDVAAMSVGANVSKFGDIVAATVFADTDTSTTILVTIPTMGNTNYFVKASPQSMGTIALDNDILTPMAKVISSTQFYIYLEETFGTAQNLRFNLEAISWDA